MNAQSLPQPGDTFLGTWTIDAQVAQGGFSVVYRARDPLGRHSALKILLSGNAEDAAAYDDEQRDRFARETDLLGRLESPYTVELWDSGTDAQTGLLYMAFEYVDGRMLFDDIKRNGRIGNQRAIHILRQTLMALESAHALGILHRDVKPANVMLYERDEDADRVKLVDFGIAKAFGDGAGAAGNDLTAAGLLVGTPRYMAPEQLRGQPMAPASDLYSLGMCAIEMVTAKKCIAGTDHIKIAEAQLRPDPIRLPGGLGLSPGLVAVIHKLTEKDRSLRYANATDALRDLEALAGDPGADGDTVYQTVSSDLGRRKSADDGPTKELEDAKSNLADPDDPTVFETVNTAEIASLIDRQKRLVDAQKAAAQGLARTEETDAFADPEPAADAVAAAGSSEFLDMPTDASVDGEAAESDAERDPYDEDIDPFAMTMATAGVVSDELLAELAETGAQYAESRPTLRKIKPDDDGVASTQPMSRDDEPRKMNTEMPTVEQGRKAMGITGPPPGVGADASGGGLPAADASASGPFGHADASRSGPIPHPDSSASGPLGAADASRSGPIQYQNDNPYGSGKYPNPTPGGVRASGAMPAPGGNPYGSGQYPEPPGGAYGSGQFQQPPQGAYGSGQFQQPPPETLPPHHDSLYSGPNRAPNAGWGGPAGPPQQPGLPERAAAGLTNEDMVTIGAAFAVPGVGQVLAGQVVKGGVTMGILTVIVAVFFAKLSAFAAFLAWLLFALVSLIDAFLLVRAQKHRPVGPYEFFADFRRLL